jgi:hypothetical protein
VALLRSIAELGVDLDVDFYVLGGPKEEDDTQPR